MTTRFLLAHGAGAPSTSAWMQRYREHFAALGPTRTFDYPYARPGATHRRTPDKLDVLIAEHRAQVVELRAASAPGDKVVLAGKSMGSRVGCHVALLEDVAGLVCLGYPLRGQNGQLRDQVLRDLRTPVLFVQGTRDALCALAELDEVRKRMTASSEVYVVEGGDHSLECTKTALKARGVTQAEIEREVLAAVERFCQTL